MEDRYFGEMAYFTEGNEEETAEAKKYLELWKKFLLARLSRDSFMVRVKDEQWGERPAWMCGMLNQQAAMTLKLCLEADFRYELGKMIP